MARSASSFQTQPTHPHSAPGTHITCHLQRHPGPRYLPRDLQPRTRHPQPPDPPRQPEKPQMGITKLAELIAESAPEAISSGPPDRYKGKTLAVDVSIFLHQFDSAMPKIVNRYGQNISILKGMFYRTAFMMEMGIKPVYVFDGTPPRLKCLKQSKAKSQRTPNLRATGCGAVSDNPKIFLGSQVKSDLEKMLRLLGIPFIQAPSEAEATCAALVGAGLASGTVTEDMDALPFGSTLLIRNLKATGKEEVKEYDLQKILKTLGMDRTQFVDLCILLGCDYCDTIQGIGRKKALTLIQQHGSIEGILKVVKKVNVPQNFPYGESRKLLLEPEVIDVEKVTLEWKEVDEEKLIQFLCKEKRFKEKDVIKKLETLRLPDAAKPTRKRKRPADLPGQQKIGRFFPIRKSSRMDKDSNQKKQNASARPAQHS